MKNQMQEWFRICDTDTREQVKAKVEKLFERVAELEKKVEELNNLVNNTPLGRLKTSSDINKETK